MIRSALRTRLLLFGIGFGSPALADGHHSIVKSSYFFEICSTSGRNWTGENYSCCGLHGMSVVEAYHLPRCEQVLSEAMIDQVVQAALDRNLVENCSLLLGADYGCYEGLKRRGQ